MFPDWASASLGLTSKQPSGPESAASVHEILLKVKQAEQALQQAREALTSFGEFHRPVATGTVSPCDHHEDLPSPAAHSLTDATAEVAPRELSEKEKARCSHIFNTVDKARTGKVSVLELRSMLQKADIAVNDKNYDDLKKRIQLADTDGDGHLDLEEFCKAFSFARAQKEGDRKRAMKDLQKDALLMQEDNMPPEEYVQMNGVPTSAVTRYLRKELDETSACLQLPQAMAIFIFFFLSVTFHFNSARLHGVDQAITWDIKENANFAFTGSVPLENGKMGNKNIEDVNNIADFWSWINMGIVPLFWPESWDVNEARTNVVYSCYGPREELEWWGGFGALDGNYSSAGDPAFGGQCPEAADITLRQDTLDYLGSSGERPLSGTYLYFHRVIGGVRLRQERTPLVACPQRVEDFQGSIFNGRCVEQMDYWLKPELHRGLSIDKSLVNLPGGETVHLLSRLSQADIREVLKGLENRAWFSPQTAKIELLFTTYNTNEDLLTATYIMFFLNRGGHIHKIVEPVSFNLDPYHGTYLCYVWDIAWASLIVKLFLEESWEIIKHLRQLGMRKGLLLYMNMSNGVDWVSIGVAVFLAVNWAQHLAQLQELKDILLAASSTTPGSYSTMAERNAFFDMVDSIVYDVHYLRTALALYPFVIVSRFFKAFSLQPRLAMVTMTLSKAATDITHFLVVFTTVFVIFGFSAMILWGQELEDFANEMRSLQSLFRILLGDFDWDSLHSIGRPQAYLWFWAFVWIVNMVMLNMLLAIIMDVYTDVKSGIGANAETLWSQSIEIWRRWRSVASGRTVSLTKILSILDPTDLESDDEAEDEEVLFPSNFAEKVPKMPEDQAFHILKAAYELKIAQEHSGDTLTDAMSRISRIDQRTMIMAEHISRFIQAQPIQHDLRRSPGSGSGSITV